MPFHRFLSLASLLLTAAGLSAGIGLVCQSAHAKKERPPRLFYFKIDDAMPLHETAAGIPPKAAAACRAC